VEGTVTITHGDKYRHRDAKLTLTCRGYSASSWHQTYLRFPFRELASLTFRPSLDDTISVLLLTGPRLRVAHGYALHRRPS
jgi:hypothetical protein